MRLKPAVTLPLAAAFGIGALSLAGCAPTDSLESVAAECVPSDAGAASDAVDVSGDFGAELTANWTSAITASEMQRTVLIDPADGAVIAQSGQIVNVYYTLFDGADGTVLERGTDSTADPIAFLNDVATYESWGMSGVAETINCASPGARIAGVLPAATITDLASQLGLAEDGALIFVVDVVSVEDVPEDTGTTEETTLESVERDDSLTRPAVDLSGEVPVVTLPAEGLAAPETLDLQILVQGDGDVVPEGATVTVNYHGVNWTNGVVFDSSYERGAESSFSLDGVIAGFKEAIVGQQVGTTLVATLPSDLAYGDDTGDTSVDGALVFVIEIIAFE